MALFEIRADGSIEVKIPDPKGELRPYTITEVAYGLSEWACELERLDTGSVHLVTFESRRWRCTCEDSSYRPGRRGQCKHIEPAQCLRAWLLKIRSPGPLPGRRPTNMPLRTTKETPHVRSGDSADREAVGRPVRSA